jgi:spermidine/putrescine transport system permease protein
MLRLLRSVLPSVALWLHAGAVYLFIYAPLVVLVAFSFTQSRYATIWSGFTWSWYGKLAQDTALLDAAQHSLVIALISTLIGTVLGTSAALGHHQLTRPTARRAVEGLFYLPIMVPEIVAAISMMIFLKTVFSTEGGVATITLSHVACSVCYVFSVVSARLRGFDPRLMEAAYDLGANRWQAFRFIQLPLLWPGVLGGALLSLVISLDEFVVAYFVTGPGVATLPIEIYGRMKKGVTPAINALATLMLLGSLLLALVAVLVQKRHGASGRLRE